MRRTRLFPIAWRNRPAVIGNDEQAGITVHRLSPLDLSRATHGLEAPLLVTPSQHGAPGHIFLDGPRVNGFTRGN